MEKRSENVKTLVCCMAPACPIVMACVEFPQLTLYVLTSLIISQCCLVHWILRNKFIENRMYSDEILKYPILRYIKLTEQDWMCRNTIIVATCKLLYSNVLTSWVISSIIASWGKSAVNKRAWMSSVLKLSMSASARFASRSRARSL